ncbi:MAG: hypothetical protein ACKVOE_04895 [Rickettsiales bacterium]
MSQQLTANRLQPNVHSRWSKKLSTVGCWLSAVLLLSGCILVDDFGHAWTESKPDSCLKKIAESLYVEEFRRNPDGVDIDAVAHGWTSGGHHYLLLKQNADDRGGRLYRFHVINGIFQRYRLVPTMREQFAHDYPNAPVSLKRDTVSLTQLNPDTEKLLAEIAAKPEYWEVEDQTLYNTLRNPACRFDDRDLSKKE